MKITDVLKQKGETVFTVKSNTSALDAVAVMDKNKIGAVIVLDAKDNVAGILSERDVLYKCYNSGKELKDQIVDNLMTNVEDLLIGKMNDTPKELMNVMLFRKIRHIPIIEDNQISAVISVEDILKMMLDSLENESHLLKQHIKNPMGIHTYKKEK